METIPVSKVLEGKIYKDSNGKIIGRVIKKENIEYSEEYGARVRLDIDTLDAKNTYSSIVLAWSNELFDITYEWEIDYSKKAVITWLEQKIIYNENWLSDTET